MKASTIQSKILTWFRKNKRQLPWRGEKNWYYIWISEVMLQQTQVETVIPYYQKFIKKFSTVEFLANASQEEVLKVWEGLGYYTRARNIHRAAKIIVEKHNSTLPPVREELLTIPGFGTYTTAAVLSLVFNQPYAVVDGNVIRVISRLYAIDEDIRNPKTRHRIQALMDSLLPSNNPGEFNEAMMELGATICTPKSPSCLRCPLTKTCIAYKKNKMNILPYKSKKERIPTRYSLACIIHQQGHILLVKRPQHEMLAGLWEFPVLRLANGIRHSKMDMTTIRHQFNIKTVLKRSWPAINHSYSHFHLKLYSKLFEATSSDFKSDFYNYYQWLGIDKIRNLPLHKAMWKVFTMVETELEAIPKRNIVNS
jgi:A/G-specific adenine glycosylase